MGQSIKDIQQIQILYEIAMSIGTSLDLRQMLRTSLSALLKKLNCSAGGVYELVESDNTRHHLEPIYTIPRRIKANSAYRKALALLPSDFTQAQYSRYCRQLPLHGQSDDKDFFHILELPDFGLIILVKSGEDLSRYTIKSLTPLLAKLADAGNACHTQQALRLSRERFRNVIASISPHVYVTNVAPNKQLKNVYISPNVEKLTGYPLKNYVQDWNFWPSTVIHPDDRRRAEAQLDIFKQGQNSEVEYRVIKADGTIIWVRDSGRVEKSADGTRITIYGVVSDVSIQKNAEQALTQAYEQAIEANQLKTQLLANVSHDLRTPLNAILGYAEMLQEGVYGNINSRQRAATGEIIDSTGLLLSFINNLLNQAQIESGRIKLRLTEFDPAEWFHAALVVFNSLAQAKGLTLTRTVAPEIPSKLRGDPYWLRQILGNLVGNALKFTEQGQVSVQLNRPTPDQWAIEVTDTGPGVSAKDQLHIFSEFKRGQEAQDKAHTGSGLGLSIVKHLAEMMGGHVKLDSRIGYGSTFTVLLPIQPPQE